MRNICTFCAVLVISSASFGQLTGSYTIPGTPYATIASAIAALNTSGVGTGGVTFNVTSGYTETFSTSTAGYITSNTGTTSNQIIFQKSGSGANPKITAPTGTGSIDAIICFNGVKYITFNGIDLYENPANTNNTTRMEWGYALLKASGTQGSQNITIKNCTISLNLANEGNVGIYSMNHTTASKTELTVTSTSGSNSGNKFYGVTCTNCYSGFYLWGYEDPVAPYTYYDQNNDIGSVSGNSINNFGGGTTLNTYAIYIRFQNNLTIANNSINGGSGTVHCVCGIYIIPGNNPNLNIYANNISLSSTVCNDKIYGLVLDGNSPGTSNTFNIYNNTISNLNFPVSCTKEAYTLYNSVPPANLNIYGNTIINNNFGRAAYIYMIYSKCGVVASAIYNNIISNNQFTGSGLIYWQIFSLFVDGSTVDVTIHDNLIYNNTVPALSGTGGARWFGIYGQALASGTFNIYNNSVHDITVTGNNNNCLELVGADLNGAPSCILNSYHNSIYNLSLTNTSSSGCCDIWPFKCVGSNTRNIYNNSIYSILCNGESPAITGLFLQTGIVSNVYNNFLYDLNIPNSNINTAGGILGFDILMGQMVNIYDNTVFLNASDPVSGFSTFGIRSSTSPILDMRNNIIVNTSIASGSGMAVAFARTSTDYSTYATTSDNNLFFAGTPGPNNLIYYDYTNSFQNLAAYQAYAVDRDQASVTEMPPFINVMTQPYNLHLQTNVVTQCESGGQTISTPVAITTDYDGDPRYPNSGYPNNTSYPATAPDIGADEFGGIGPVTAPTVVTNAATSIGSTTATLNGTVTANGSNTTPSFDWGTSTSYGNNIAATPSSVSGNTPTSVSANLTGLTISTTYHFRCKGVNGIGTSYGNDTIFTTLCPVPDTAGTISGTPNVCEGVSGVPYSVQQIPNATYYIWILPPGATIASGSGSNSITVDFADNASSGDITVTGNNICGNGGTSPPYYVTVNPIPPTPVITLIGGDTLVSSAPTGNQWYFEGIAIPGATGQTYIAIQFGWYWDIVTLDGCSSDTSNHWYLVGGVRETGQEYGFSVYPNPGNGIFTLALSAIPSQSFDLSVINNQGIIIYELKRLSIKGFIKKTLDLRSFPAGLYTVRLRNTKSQVSRKIEIER